MPAIYPFRAIRYASESGDLSALTAPPYDVIGADQRAELLRRDSANVVGFDLPHVPAKELGPPEAYEQAGETLRRLLNQGRLVCEDTPAIYVYQQSVTRGSDTVRRVGVACTLDTVPFGARAGGGILPHEQTFGGPKADRLALMHATGCQLSPIFGLYPDESGVGAQSARAMIADHAPDMHADLGDGVLHEVWRITDAGAIRSFTEALNGEDVFVADGHHRYNTALNYLEDLRARGGAPGPHHPATRTMFVLVSMSDPGLEIWPTHRVLGGMSAWSMERFIDAASGLLHVEAIQNDPHTLEPQIESIARREGTNAFGLYDYQTGLCFAGWPACPDPLGDTHADRHESWRRLDVAVVQHLIVEQICEPELNDSQPVRWSFPHTIEELLALGRGNETGSSAAGSGRPQLGIVLRPTPLESVRAVSLAGELMPQKSTFFSPKLLTGLFMNPLDDAFFGGSGLGS